MSETCKPGEYLRRALQERGSVLQADEARALAEALISLIAKGAIVASTDSETAPAYNMGQSVCIDGD